MASYYCSGEQPVGRKRDLFGYPQFLALIQNFGMTSFWLLREEESFFQVLCDAYLCSHGSLTFYFMTGLLKHILVLFSSKCCLGSPV